MSLKELLVIEILLKLLMTFRDNYIFSRFNTFKALQKTNHKSAAGKEKEKSFWSKCSLFTAENPWITENNITPKCVFLLLFKVAGANLWPWGNEMHWDTTKIHYSVSCCIMWFKLFFVPLSSARGHLSWVRCMRSSWLTSVPLWQRKQPNLGGGCELCSLHPRVPLPHLCFATGCHSINFKGKLESSLFNCSHLAQIKRHLI